MTSQTHREAGANPTPAVSEGTMDEGTMDYEMSGNFIGVPSGIGIVVGVVAAHVYLGVTGAAPAETPGFALPVFLCVLSLLLGAFVMVATEGVRSATAVKVLLAYFCVAAPLNGWAGWLLVAG